MANTYTCLNIHCVFSTKNRKNLIDNEIRDRLWAYMGGIARQNKMISYAVGGTENHVHILLSIPATINPSKAVQLIKAGSSKWIHEEFSGKAVFSWQAGYGAFSVSPNRLNNTIDYIRNQEAHHRVVTFEEEYIRLLKDCGIPYDDRFVLD